MERGGHKEENDKKRGGGQHEKGWRGRGGMLRTRLFLAREMRG